MASCNNDKRDNNETDNCDNDDCLVRFLELPPTIQYGGIEIDIAVMEQAVPKVNVSDPDSIYNLVPLPMTYRQMHQMFYPTNNEFTLNPDVLAVGEQSVYKNTRDPFVAWNENTNPMMDLTVTATQGRNLRMADLVSFERQHYMSQQGPPSTVTKFNLYNAVLGLYEKCLGKHECWNPCAKVEFEKYIGSIKSVFDVGGACSNVECSLTLDELFSMLDESGYSIENKTGMPYAQGESRYPAPDLSGNERVYADNYVGGKNGFAWSRSQVRPVQKPQSQTDSEPSNNPSSQMGPGLNPYVSNGNRSQVTGTGATLPTVFGANSSNPEATITTVDGSDNITMTQGAWPTQVRNLPMISLIIVFKSCTPGVSDLQVRMNYLLDFQPANNLPMILDSREQVPIRYPRFMEELNYWRPDARNRYAFDVPNVTGDETDWQTNEMNSAGN
tara:strand:+ start:227 stop:1555 length:1329 start_codon:yes stop_codon:yes gene_type:complete